MIQESKEQLPLGLVHTDSVFKKKKKRQKKGEGVFSVWNNTDLEAQAGSGVVCRTGTQEMLCKRATCLLLAVLASVMLRLPS